MKKVLIPTKLDSIATEILRAHGGYVVVQDAKTPLPGSHRHLSNIMGMFPFNLITCEGTWVQSQLSYTQRLVVFTDLVASSSSHAVQ